MIELHIPFNLRVQQSFAGCFVASRILGLGFAIAV